MEQSKLIYEKPVLEQILFEREEIVTLSQGDPDKVLNFDDLKGTW